MSERERTPYIAANWKMHKTVAEAVEYMDELLPQVDSAPCEVVLCPPFTALAAVAERARGSAVAVGAQNMHEDDSGAYTGEVSAEMLTEAGAGAVILGHSERRQLFGETDEALARKVPAALDAGLTPILCVGESEKQRDAGRTEEIVADQLRADLAGLGAGASRLTDVVIAYEPIWAIGTGKTATAGQAQEACAFIRATVADLGADPDSVRILYGGSVKPEGAAELLSLPDVDGALVGGASLDPADFATIVNAT